MTKNKYKLTSKANKLLEAGKVSSNPFINAPTKRVKRLAKFEFESIKDKNPIPAEITDPEDLQEFYNKVKLLPYHGTNEKSQDGLLYFNKSISKLSNTLGSVINSIATYAFSAKMNVQRCEDEEFCTDDDYVDEEQSLKFKKETQVKGTEKKDFTKTIRDIIVPDISFKYDVELIYRLIKEAGICFIKLTHTEVAGIKKSSYQVIRVDNCRYVAREDKKKTHGVISDSFTLMKIVEKKDFSICSVYPKYMNESGKGIKQYSTLIPVHAPTTNYNYALPDWFQAFMCAYNEYQDQDYQIKQSSINFTGQAFIELEDDEMDLSTLANEASVKNGFDSLQEELHANFAADSDDPQTIFLTTRPYGSSPAMVYQFKPNLNENYFKVKGENNEESIIAANQWSKRFLGKNESQGFSANVFIDELRVKEVGVLNYVRELSLRPINLCIKEALKFNSITKYSHLRVSMQTNFDLLKDFIISGDRQESSKNDISKHLKGKYDE